MEKINYNFSSDFIKGEIEPQEEEYYRTIDLIYSIIKNIEDKDKIIEDLEINLKENILKFGLRKPPSFFIPYYSFIFPFHYDKKIDSIKIDVCGYAGITYFKIIDKSGNEFIPEGIKNIEEYIENPTDLLIENLRWTYIGLREIKAYFQFNEFKDIISSITIKMKKNDT